METRTFFEAVFGEQEGHVVITLPNVAGKPTKDNWFQYPDDLDDMVGLVEANSHTDVWYSPIIFKSESRTKENADTVQILAADADTCEPENFRARPNLVVETSTGRYHVYWLLEDVIDANEAAKINRRIAQVHKEQGCDPAFVNAAKLLRVPGTSNNKHPGEVVIVNDFDPDYPYIADRLEEAYPADEIPDMIEAQAEEMPADLQKFVSETNLSSLLSGMPNNVEIRSLLYGSYHDDKRSEVLFKLCCLLFEEGMDDRTVAAIAWNARANKFNGEDPRGLKGLWDTAVAKAKAVVASGTSDYDDQYQDEEGGEKRNYQLVKQPTEFLTLDELEEIAYQPTFIQEWATWAKTKSDAPPEYHVAGAVILLSTIYSQFGYVLPTFGKLKLNIWMSVLGRSTKDRKTTAKSYVERMLRRMSTDEFSYILPGDSTPGGLEVALQDRANKSSIISRDEAQGFFEEMLHQSYMSGGISYFTSLYDGRSMGRARASGDKKQAASVEVSFVFFLLGILDDSAEALTIRNFKQGFLTRFLYTVADRPEGYVEPPIKFVEEDKREEDDEVFNSLQKQLEIGRNHWSMLNGEGEMTKISLTPEAEERFVKFREDVVAAVNDTKYREVIDSTSDRMTLSVLKLAALLAMHERRQKIELNDMLQAISYAGRWFDNAVTVASMISESEWQRDVTKLEEHIMAKGGKLSWFRAYQAFPDKKPKDFEEMVVALETRGSLIRTQVGSRWHLEVQYEE
jgi:hypothetical protein